MRLGRITKLSDTPAAPDMTAVLARHAQQRMLTEYRKGLRDGIRMMLDHVEGKEAGGEPYHGPLPDELQTYLRGVRDKLDTA